MLARPSFPRLTSRGCVEATTRPRSPPCARTFPRLTSRGCVEAPRSASDMATPRPFHDSRVVAALKPGRRCWRCACSVSFPRLTSRGCVEAPPTIPPASPSAAFPRLTSRGCVEAADWSRPTTSCDRPFHDSRVVAALKRSESGRWLAWLGTFHDSRVVAALKHRRGRQALGRQLLSTTHESWLR